MERCYIGLGGNVGRPYENIVAALQRLAGTEGIFQMRASRLYETTPVSSIPQPNFYNAVAQFQTDMGIEELFGVLEGVERALGKVAKAKEAPRPIDIDLLFYGDEVYQSQRVTVPHPRWHERPFVIIPLCELVEDLSWNNLNIINKYNKGEEVVLAGLELPFQVV